MVSATRAYASSWPCMLATHVQARPGPHAGHAAEVCGHTGAPNAGCWQVWNPGFDVTPAELIQGIITERGVIERGPGGAFDVRSFMAAHGLLPDAQGAPAPAAA